MFNFEKQPSRIVFAVSMDDDWDCTFDVTVAYGTIEAHMHFYGQPDTWSQFGKQLLNFPRNPADSAVFEGGVNTKGYDFMCLKAYCYDAGGHTALKVIIDNNAEEPRECRIEFSILSEPASLTQLGRLLAGWDVRTVSERIWEAQTS
ncbi:hypothetical protein [Hymenobacter lucidus]|uniref:Uncharacterized protein n=1 Tax=Hymenobacter lucidus TaxID=2880930 RepID=A0ABS8ANW6_9BACT|nr:hypothetical protein [Hymenobacter lucidus]MCB2407471.1 hypothetical protein [Hymenobacter lucidus]